MAESPADLVAARADQLWVTGLASDALGVAADKRHLESGGYHCGSLDLLRIDAIGKDEYSIRQPRDRAFYRWEIAHNSNWASAEDIGKTWARGGVAAWLRFNALLRLQLGARDPLLSAVRGINYTNAAGAVRRFDCVTHQESSSTDRDHTHVEYWRDTVDTAERARALSRIIEIMVAARDQTPLPAPPAVPAVVAAQRIEGDMIYQVTDVPAGAKDAAGNDLVENGQCVATPNGPFNFTGSEWFSMGKDETHWPPRIKITHARLTVLCDALNPVVPNTVL